MKAGWQTKRLGDVLEIQNGYAFDSKRFSTSNGLPLVRIRSLKTGVEKDTFFDGEYDDKYTVSDGDLLIGMDGEFGCFEWKGGKALLNQRVCRLQNFNSQLLPRFLFYGISAYLKAIEEVTGFATVKHLSSKQVLGIEFPVPPISEQQRIADILDAAFAEIGTAKDNAEKNLQSARALFESYLNKVFTERGEGWLERRLSELCERITKGSSPKWQGISYVKTPGVLFVTSENVGEYEIRLEQPKYVEDDFNLKDKKSILMKGDVLSNIVGASIGRTAVFDRHDVANINQAVCLIRCDPHLLYNKYLVYLLNSPVFRKVLHDNEVNNARANLSLGFFSSLMVPLPSIQQQVQLVANLDGLRAETKRLESIFQEKLIAHDELKKSLLNQAFSGNL